MCDQYGFRGMLNVVGMTSRDEAGYHDCFRPPGGSRWDFIQGEAALANSRMSSAMRTTSAKLYRRKLQKRLMHHEHQLYALQQAKKSFSLTTPGGAGGSTDKGGAVCPDVEIVIKAQQEQLFNKKLKQYSSKVYLCATAAASSPQHSLAT